MTDQQGALFDRLSASGELYRYAPEALSRLRELLPDKGFVLDVGCGDGVIGQALGAQRIVGFDISFRCAQLATRRGVHSVVADACLDLPFETSTFDSVYCVDVLHHLPDHYASALRAIDRVLRPGGSLVLVEPDAQYALVRWTQAPWSPIRVAPFENEPAIYAEQLTSILQDMGYTFTCRPIRIDGHQLERSGFPLWQRLLKAPFVLALAWWHGKKPNKFAIVARKKG